MDAKLYAVAGLAILLAGGFIASTPSETASEPKTSYGFLTADKYDGIIPNLMTAGEAPSADSTAPETLCHDESYYIDKDGDRGVEYYSGDNIMDSAGYYYTGYDKAYADAEVCGGRYNYQCEEGSTTCGGFVSDDPDDGSDDGSDNEDTNERPQISNIDAPSTAKTGEQVTIQADASDDGYISSYEWSNGKTGSQITQVYDTTGLKELTLTVEDDEGATSQADVSIKVEPREEDQDSGGGSGDEVRPVGEVGFVQFMVDWVASWF